MGARNPSPDGKPPKPGYRPKPVIYLIGSLRNAEVLPFATWLESELDCEVFTSWFAAGPEADDKWRLHEIARGRSYAQSLKHYAAQHVFAFDKEHIERADAVLLVLPAGKSGHLELGWALGQGKPGFIFLDNPDRWDVMYLFASGVTDDKGELLEMLTQHGLKHHG